MFNLNHNTDKLASVLIESATQNKTLELVVS